MLCNVDRLVALMEEKGLDAIVASSFENVYYFSGTGSRLPFYTGTGAAAVITRERNPRKTHNKIMKKRTQRQRKQRTTIQGKQ